MNFIYIVLCNGIVIGEGYSTEQKAINFIESRYGNPKQVEGMGWLWMDDRGNEYKIKEISVI